MRGVEHWDVALSSGLAELTKLVDNCVLFDGFTDLVPDDALGLQNVAVTILEYLSSCPSLRHLLLSKSAVTRLQF